MNKNLVRLLAKAAPPRTDVAQQISWNLSRSAGGQGILKIVDGHDDDRFTWLAVGRFDPPVVGLAAFIPNSLSQRQQDAADMARTVPLSELKTKMRQLYVDENNRSTARAAAVEKPWGHESDDGATGRNHRSSGGS